MRGGHQRRADLDKSCCGILLPFIGQKELICDCLQQHDLPEPSTASRSAVDPQITKRTSALHRMQTVSRLKRLLAQRDADVKLLKQQLTIFVDAMRITDEKPLVLSAAVERGDYKLMADYCRLKGKWCDV